MIRGSCLCGQVRYEIAGKLRSITHCHCNMCQKTHGAAFASYAEVDKANLSFTSGESSITRYVSSDRAQRHFCSRCGSNLTFEEKQSPDRVWVAAGSFDSETDVRPSAHIYVASKVSWWDIADDLPQHPGAPD